MSAAVVSTAANARVMEARAAAVARHEERSIRLRTELVQLWKNVVRKLPRDEQRRWLDVQDAISQLADQKREDLAEQIEHLRRRLDRCVPSPTWTDDVVCRGAEFPPGGKLTGMVLSHIGTRIGSDETPSQRFTPPQCRSEEDMIDGITDHRRAAYLGAVEWPGSISADVIIKIGHLRAHNEDRKREKRERRAQAIREQQSRRQKVIVTPEFISANSANAMGHLNLAA